MKRIVLNIPDKDAIESAAEARAREIKVSAYRRECFLRGWREQKAESKK